MKLYSDYPARRARQIVTDVLALVAIGAWVWLGIAVYQLVENLKAFGVQMEQSGAGFRQTMTDISNQLGGVPLIGGGIKVPFDGASNAGGALEQAGEAQQVAVHQLATGLGIGIAALPVATILLLWLIPRLRFARKATTAMAMSQNSASVDLLALRALSSRKLKAINAIDPDAAAAWRRGDDTVIRALASLELKASGVRLR